jgi:hypothetical protein
MGTPQNDAAYFLPPKAPLPQPPFYTVPNISNLRDATASLPKASTGHKLRTNILFRSADVSKLDPSGWKTLHDELGIGHVFDLRSKPEIERTVTEEERANPDFVKPKWIQDCEDAGIQRHWVPVFEEADYSPERLAERYVKYMDDGEDGFVQAYEDILRHAGVAYGEIFRYLASLAPAEAGKKEGAGAAPFLSNNPDAPIPDPEVPIPGAGDTKKKDAKGALIHCTAGKDRTGIFFGVLFKFLGMDDEAIATEYNLTEAGLGDVREGIVDRLALSPAFREYAAKKLGKEVEALDQETVGQMGKKAAARMVGARKESMLRSLKMVERIWGSAEGYLKTEIGLGDRELDGLRKSLILEDSGR